MPIYNPSNGTATVAQNTNAVTIAGADLTGISAGMLLSLNARDRKTGDEYIIASVTPNGVNGGSLTTVGSISTAYTNAPFVIDTSGFSGTGEALATQLLTAVLSALNVLFGPNLNVYTGNRQITLDKLSSTAVGRVLCSIAGRTWADIDHSLRTYTPAGGAAIQGQVLALRAFADGTTPTDALLIDLATGGCDVRKAAVTMVSATTTDLSSAPFAKVLLTGAAAITSFGTGKHLERRVTVVDGGATLTHNATSLILPGATNIVTKAGDTFDATSSSTGNWRVHNYTRADGTPLVLPTTARQPSFRRRNLNGDFSVNQRSVSGTVTLAAGAYGHDCWKAGASGCTYTFSTTNGVTILTITAGSLQQVIEGGLNLPEGGTYALAWGGTAQGRWFSGTYAASPLAVSGAVAGANGLIEFGTGTLSLVQFEPGSTATPFEYRDDEKRRCQRYFRTSYDGATPGSANVEATSIVIVPVVSATGSFFSTLVSLDEMRVNPTITTYSAKTGAVNFAYAQNAAADLATRVYNQSRKYFTNSLAGANISANDFIKFHFTASAEF